MINLQTFQGLYERHVNKLHAKKKYLTVKYPFEKYVEHLANKPLFAGYREPGHEILSLCRAIESEDPLVSLDAYHRCFLLYLVVYEFQKLNNNRYPESIQDLFAREYKRIAVEVETNPVGFYSYDNDLFCKDLGICTHRMFPAGALKVEALSGVPRRVLLSFRPGQLLKGMKQILLSGGFRPFYEMHLDIRYKEDFDPKGWDNAFCLIAEMLVKNPHIKGLTGASWFFDPQIPRISPRLTYLRQRIEENGGKFLFYQSDEKTTQFAISKSSTRKRLYEKGLYRPASYLAIWSRENIISFAQTLSSVRGS